MRSEVLAGRRKSVHVWVGCGAGGPVCTGSRVRLKAGGAMQGTSGAHVEHVAHVRDRGGVEVAERLVE